MSMPANSQVSCFKLKSLHLTLAGLLGASRTVTVCLEDLRLGVDVRPESKWLSGLDSRSLRSQSQTVAKLHKLTRAGLKFKHTLHTREKEVVFITFFIFVWRPYEYILRKRTRLSRFVVQFNFLSFHSSIKSSSFSVFLPPKASSKTLRIRIACSSSWCVWMRRGMCAARG